MVRSLTNLVERNFPLGEYTAGKRVLQCDSAYLAFRDMRSGPACVHAGLNPINQNNLRRRRETACRTTSHWKTRVPRLENEPLKACRTYDGISTMSGFRIKRRPKSSKRLPWFCMLLANYRYLELQIKVDLQMNIILLKSVIYLALHYNFERKFDWYKKYLQETITKPCRYRHVVTGRIYGCLSFK